MKLATIPNNTKSGIIWFLLFFFTITIGLELVIFSTKITKPIPRSTFTVCFASHDAIWLFVRIINGTYPWQLCPTSYLRKVLHCLLFLLVVVKSSSALGRYLLKMGYFASSVEHQIFPNLFVGNTEDKILSSKKVLPTVKARMKVNTWNSSVLSFMYLLMICLCFLHCFCQQ